MAVVSISRIQLRRGQKNQGSGLPQLASAEMGWAIDTQELYIGNGSVSEGAPSVGNTKILTEHDNLFQLIREYTYRETSGIIQTGASSNTPVRRNLQERLDDRVSIRSFGAQGDGTNQTLALQRAIDQLFLNNANKSSPASRVVLYLEPGVYIVDSPIKLPPYANIVGAGKDKTVIRCTNPNSAVFSFKNGSSTPGNDALDATTTFLNQPREIRLSDMTIDAQGGNIGIDFRNVRNSDFSNLKIVGSWTQGTLVNNLSKAITFYSLSSSVNCNNIVFRNLHVAGFSYGLYADYDIKDVNVDTSIFETLAYGIVVGENMNYGLIGQTIGSDNLQVTKTKFRNIDRHGIWIEHGTRTVSSHNDYRSVGYDSGTFSNARYAILKFTEKNNISDNDFFDRTQNLSYNQTYISGVKYVPEIEGPIFYKNGSTHKVDIAQNSSATTLFRLPGDKNSTYIVKYLFESNANSVRQGTMNIIVNRNDNTVQLHDEYDYSGSSVYDETVIFSAVLSDQDGDVDPDTILVQVEASLDSGPLTFEIEVKA